MKRLSQKKFFQVLAERAKVNGFKLEADSIREKRTNNCPITAVCFALTKKKFSAINYSDAAKEINLSENFKDNIVDKSDFDPFTDEISSTEERKLRNKLLIATNLKELI